MRAEEVVQLRPVWAVRCKKRCVLGVHTVLLTKGEWAALVMVPPCLAGQRSLERQEFPLSLQPLFVCSADLEQCKACPWQLLSGCLRYSRFHL